MNTMNNADKGRRRGFALVVTLGIVLIVSIASAGIFGLVRQEMHMARLTRDFLNARVIAEAGANEYYAQIRRNFTGFGEQDAVLFGDGEYQVTLTEIKPEWAELRSVGRVGISEATVALTLRNFVVVEDGEGNVSVPSVLQNALTSGGAMDLKGTVTVNGALASADSITVSGGSANLNGEANSPSIDDKHNRITGVKGNDPTRYTIDWDSFLNLDAFLAHAVKWDGRDDVTSYPDNTILFVDGSISIAASTALRLSIIATGDISITGSAKLLKPATYPTLVSIDGSIKMAGNSSAEGLVAVMNPSGSLQITGGGGQDSNITGSVVLAGAVTDAGTWRINHGETIIAPPGADPDGEDHVVVIAWN